MLRQKHRSMLCQTVASVATSNTQTIPINLTCLPGEATPAGAGGARDEVLEEGALVTLPAEWQVPLQRLHDGGRPGQGETLPQQARVLAEHLQSWLGHSY